MAADRSAQRSAASSFLVGHGGQASVDCCQPSLGSASTQPFTRGGTAEATNSVSSIGAPEAGTSDDATEPSEANAQGASQPRGHRSHDHIHGPLNPQKALNTGGLCFAPVYNEIDNAERRSGRRLPFQLMSVGLQALTGVITGIAAFAVGNISERLGRLRLDVTVGLIQRGLWLESWLASCGIMMCLALVGALPVILCVTTAGSSGIPAIIGILNGCDLTPDFTFKTLLVRLVGVTCAVASGLAVGPEGPMIFIGACTGALLSRIPSQPSVWRHLGRPPSSLNHHVYLRDYISTGAACGIAAAFRAPIAGTLFVVEEAASHFRREHLAKIFFGSLLAMLFATYLAGEEGLLEYQVTTGKSCRTWQWLQAIDYVFFVIVGVVCGMAGALFNYINLQIVRWRARHVNATMPWRRSAEIACLCVVTSACWMVLPLCTLEKTAGDPQIFSRGDSCIKDRWLPQIIKGATIEGTVGLNLKYSPEPCLYGVQYNASLCSKAWSLSSTSSEPGSRYAKACTHDLIQGPQFQGNHRSYCCNFTSIESLSAGRFQLPSNASCSIHLGESFPSLRSQDQTAQGLRQMWRTLRLRTPHEGQLLQNSFNPMAALTLVSFDATAQNLFSRGAPYVLSPWVLLFFLPVYFLLAAATSGSAIPSGLLLPMIIIGALIGRILAVAFISLQVALGWYQPQTKDGSMWSSVFQPLFHYSGGPLSASAPLSTIGWLDPGVGAIIGAAAFLGGCSRISLTITVMMVEITGDPTMIAPVGVATLAAVVVGNRCNHGLYHSLIDIASFPFLPDRWPKTIPKALRVEHTLQEGQQAVCISLMAQRSEVEFVLEKNAYTGFPVLDQDGVVVGFAMRQHLQQLLDHLTDTVDVGRVTDFHCVTIRKSLPLEVAYDLFKRMEISHMIVVDNNHRPKAMLTRGSLLPWSVAKKIGHNRMCHVRSTIQRPRTFRRGNLNVDATFATFGTEHLHSEAEHGQAFASSTDARAPSQPPSDLGLDLPSNGQGRSEVLRSEVLRSERSEMRHGIKE